MDKKVSLKININELALNQRKFDTQEIGRGIGVQKPKKGKGSYTRNEKHKKNGCNIDNHSFFYYISNILKEYRFYPMTTRYKA